MNKNTKIQIQIRNILSIDTLGKFCSWFLTPLYCTNHLPPQCTGAVNDSIGLDLNGC